MSISGGQFNRLILIFIYDDTWAIAKCLGSAVVSGFTRAQAQYKSRHRHTHARTHTATPPVLLSHHDRNKIGCGCSLSHVPLAFWCHLYAQFMQTLRETNITTQSTHYSKRAAGALNCCPLHDWQPRLWPWKCKMSFIFHLTIDFGKLAPAHPDSQCNS